MKKYFYSDGTNKHGPFTLEELKLENIDRTTKVWFHGLENWQDAGATPELDEIFVLTPPPIESTDSPIKITPTNSGEKLNAPPKTWLLESILVTLFCCLPFGIAGIVNASSVESKYYAGDIEGSLRSSEEAKKWTKVSFIVGLVVSILYVFIMIAAEM